MMSNWSQNKVPEPAYDQSKVDGWFVVFFVIAGLILLPADVYSQEAVTADTTSAEVGEIEGKQAKTTIFSEMNGFTEFIDYGDYSVRQALKRMSGVQVSRDGEVNIRGAGYQNFGVLVNGSRLAPTGMGTRDIALDALSADGLQSIELIKVLDPSMDADALSGLISIDTENFVSDGKQRALSAIIGGGANTDYISRSGPGNRAWLKYAEHFNEELSLSVNLNYHQSYNSLEELQLGFGSQDFGSGFVDVYDRVSPAVIINGNGRFSTSTHVNYSPKETSKYYFSAFYNENRYRSTIHQDSWTTGGDFSFPDTTGLNGEEGAFIHNASMQENQVSQLAFTAGGENDFESYIISYQAGWSQGRTDAQYYQFPFQIEELNYALDLGTAFRPQMEITNSPTQILDDGTVDRQFMIGQNFHRTLQDHNTDQLTGQVDFEFPLNAGAIKAGLSSRISFQESEYEQDQFDYNRTLRLISFNMLREPNRNVDVINDNYRIPWFLNTEHAKAFLESQRPLFTGDDSFKAYQSEIRNHATDEQIYASYVMADLNFGNLDVKAGARIEYELFETTGNEIIFDDQGDIAGIQDTTVEESRFHLFPNLQVGFQITEQSRIDLAYSSTIDRPDYFMQAPFLRVHNQDSTRFTGNTNLDPATANNFDLKLTQQISSSGVISVAGFYKSINDLIVQRVNVVNEFDQTEFLNTNETANVYGAEFTVNQRLDFLPGILSDLGIYANYTWSQSNFKAFEDREEMPLTGQSPHVINAALNYDIPRFTAQISYHWSDDLLTDIANVQQRAPSLEQGLRYLDKYENGYRELSATASYQLSERFRIWANVRQMLNNERISYLERESAYPESTYINSGLDLRVGVRFDL